MCFPQTEYINYKHCARIPPWGHLAFENFGGQTVRRLIYINFVHNHRWSFTLSTCPTLRWRLRSFHPHPIPPSPFQVRCDKTFAGHTLDGDSPCGATSSCILLSGRRLYAVAPPPRRLPSSVSFWGPWCAIWFVLKETRRARRVW